MSNTTQSKHNVVMFRSIEATVGAKKMMKCPYYYIFLPKFLPITIFLQTEAGLEISGREHDAYI